MAGAHSLRPDLCRAPTSDATPAGRIERHPLQVLLVYLLDAAIAAAAWAGSVSTRAWSLTRSGISDLYAWPDGAHASGGTSSIRRGSKPAMELPMEKSETRENVSA
jgi:hypothetical protein